jgi:hypothetical protein
VWQNHLNQGDFDGAINSCLVSKFKVSDYAAPPPPLEGLTVGTINEGQEIYGYSDGSNITAFGNLNPKEFANTGIDLKSVVYQFNGGSEYVLVLEQTPDIGDINVTIGTFIIPCFYDPFGDDEDLYIGTLNGQAALDLLNYLQSNVGNAVAFSTSPPSDFDNSNNDFADNGDFDL